jgi:hypothetical protein
VHPGDNFVHLGELFFVGVNHDVDAIVERFEVGVGNEGSDLDDHVPFWLKAGHL